MYLARSRCCLRWRQGGGADVGGAFGRRSARWRWVHVTFSVISFAKQHKKQTTHLQTCAYRRPYNRLDVAGEGALLGFNCGRYGRTEDSGHHGRRHVFLWEVRGAISLLPSSSNLLVVFWTGDFFWCEVHNGQKWKDFLNIQTLML